MKTNDLPIRSMVKSFSYRLNGTLITVLVVYLITGNLNLSLSASGLDFIFKIFLFYFHERIWERIPWGKKSNISAVIWFTAYSGAGKTTLADKLAKDLADNGINHELIDGDSIRSHFKDIGFSREERIRHLTGMAFLASKLERQGTVVIGSFITPYEEVRKKIRSSCHRYIEVWIDTPLEECEKRDIKGLYKKARSGEIASFTGISDEFEHPEFHDIRVSTFGKSTEESYHDLITGLAGKIPELKMVIR